MKIKKSHVSIGLLFLILSLTVVGSIKQTFKPQYKFETPKSSDGEITIVTPENKTYTEPMSGYYPATYGFENDEDGTIPDEWEEVKGDPSILNEIIAELDGHKKVLHMDKGNTYGDNNYLNQYFKSIQEHGTIEFWGRTTDTSQESSWHLKSGSFGQYSIAGVRIMDSSFQFKNSSEWYPVPYNANSDQWYHIKIQFECGTGNNYGLAQYKWRFFINSVQFGDFQMISSHSNVSHIIIHQNWRYDNFHMYTDAVGYSWDSNYNVGDNLNEGILFSYENTTNLDWKGYSLDGQTNKTIMGNTTIPVPDDGLHSIHMFGNDSMGTMYASNLRYFSVNTAPPEITINSPTPSQTIGSTGPTYDISITGIYDSIWYTLDGGATNLTANSLTGTINQAAWTALADGIITVTFFANNSAGMEGSAQVMVIKDSSEEPPPSPPPGIPGYNLLALIGVTLAVTLILAKRKHKK